MMPIVISMGDPSGIGPEIVVKAWQNLRSSLEIAFVIIGDFETIQLECARQGIPAPALINAIEEFDENAFSSQISVISPVSLDVAPSAGRPETKNASAIIEYIEYGAKLCQDGRARALVTLPISKSVLYKAGFAFPGHTEFIADLCSKWNNRDITPVMMLMAQNVKVALATIHLPLLRAIQELDSEKIETITKAVHQAMRTDFGIQKPKIAVLGLNPHAGENGDLGREEIEIINPVCSRLRDAGIDCSDALPSDSAFSPEKREKYDAYIAMYHDQGLIPVKTIDFWGGVNVTLGLPIIRTSPDHGTGYEIAGQGVANPLSLINAIKCAHNIHHNREFKK